MYTLFVKPGCPFCAKVLQLIEAKGIEVTLKETTEPGVVEELIAHGGQKQVPYLIDEERGTSMYESDDIVAYLVTRMSGDATMESVPAPMENLSSGDAGEEGEG